MEWLILLGVVLVLALCAIAVFSTHKAERERARIAQEARLADFQVKQLTRAAMAQMLFEARRRP